MPLNHDRIIKPQPHMMAHTLADYLMPDIEIDATVSAITVDEVLRSILVDGDMEDSGVTINEDGTYTIGLIQGHAVPVENVRFIGKNARKKYREDQIKKIETEIAQLMERKNETEDNISALHEDIEEADMAINSFPDDGDLEESYTQMKEIQFQIEQTEKLFVAKDQEMQRLHEKFQTIKRKLDVETRELNIEFTYKAYQEAQDVMRRYERDLNHFINKHLTYRHHQDNLQQIKLRIEELIGEVDDLSGELNVLQDKQTRIKRNVSEIEKQLESLGVADIRQQIQDVQTQMTETMDELNKNRSLLPKTEADKETLSKEIATHEQRVQFWQRMIEAWFDVFQQELNYQFVQIPEDMEGNDEIAKWIMKQYGKLLKEKDASNINSQLTSVYFEQHSNLMEYRMTDDHIPATTFAWMDEEWTEEQKILITNWKEKAARRLIQLDFQGKRV